MDAVTIETELGAPRDAVYRAWTEPSMLAGWLCEQASGDARVGSVLELTWPSLGQALTLEVDIAEPPHRLQVQAQVGGALQTQGIVLHDRGESTAIELYHQAPRALHRGIANGWRLRLFVLEHYLRWGGKRTVEVVAGTGVGDESAVFDRLAQSARLHLGEPAMQLAPDGLCGTITDGVIYVLRRFALTTPSHLLAAQLMTWQDHDLEELHRAMESLIAHSTNASPSGSVH
ncbi:MAG: SRPBCC domain-containing protein [Deltaproteobacteria bacterium]|nr:SRPBCC domain-containing protein [Deltaproteobacteria bacterium]